MNLLPLMDDLPELASVVQEICVSQEALAADAWKHVVVAASPRAVGPGHLRRWVPQVDILPIMDWAYLASVWHPRGEGICGESWWRRKNFGLIGASVVLQQFIRHFCIRQEEEMLLICRARGDAEPGWGRVPGRVADARFLALCDAARKAGVWTPLTQVLLEVEG